MLLALQIIVCIFLVALGGFFAGSETGIYRLSRFALRMGIEQSRSSYTLLSKIMDDSGGLIFSMLIGTNLVHYMVTALVTAILLVRSVGSAELLATVIVSPVLFIFSEVIPKNIYYYRADSLMPRFGAVLWFFHKFFTYSGLVAFLKYMSRFFTFVFSLPAGSSPAVDKDCFRQIIRESREEGLLSSVQNDMMHRLVNIDKITLASIRTPVASVRMVDVNTPSAILLERLTEWPYTRLPVYQASPDTVIGFINVYEVLTAGRDCDNLKDFVKPISRFASSMLVIDAIDLMIKHGEKIVLITAGNTKKREITGIVTMKDLIEELTGELTQW
jgi:putative hemolysin